MNADNVTMTLIDTERQKTCDVDPNALTPEATLLKRIFTNVLLDGDQSTCQVCFESGSRLLQVMFSVLNIKNNFEINLVGRNLNCQEPYTVVFTRLSAAAVKKQQCVLHEQTMLDNAAGDIKCKFVCFVTLCLQDEVQVTALLASLTWRMDDQPHAQLCEVFSSRIYTDTF